MGKDLKNRELGKGLSQRKDGRYSARFVDKTGRRTEKYFDTLPKARNWLDDARYKDKYESVLAPFEIAADGILDNDDDLTLLSDMTVDGWFSFWINNLVSDLRPNTLRNYKNRYEANIKPVMGRLKMKDVKALHCKKVLMDMTKDYASSTIRQTYIAMGTMFKAALMNGVILTHPMNGVKPIKKPKGDVTERVLTKEEQERFIDTARWSSKYPQFALVLETGLRTAELIGLTWDCVDFKNRTITVNKALEYRHDFGEWSAGPPKTESGYRTLPLTAKAYDILAERYAKRQYRKEAEGMNAEYEYKDRLTGGMKTLKFKDLVFVSERTGMPSKSTSYDTCLYKICETAGIKKIGMHVLRHTYATRAIERGVNPKALQKLLGHSSLQTTMDTYVHVTDDSKLLAVRIFESASVHDREDELKDFVKNGVNGVDGSEKMA
jgi:integrase